MTTNSFSIASSWGARQETPAQFGARVLEALDTFSAISPIFRPWWLFNTSLAVGNAWKRPKAQHYFSLDYARHHMTEIVQMGVHRDEGEFPLPVCGYTIVAMNSQLRSPATVNFHAHGADSCSDQYRRSASFKTEFRQVPAPELVAYPVFKAVLLALVSIFDVAYARAYSSEFSAQWRRPEPRFLDLSWMTYLSAPLARQIAIPPDIVTERLENGGLLMIAAQQTFDVNNPEHMQGARSILQAMAPLNDAADKKRRQEQEQWKKAWLSRPEN